MELESTPFSLQGILRELTTTMGFTAKEKNLRLYYDIDPEVPDDLQGDPTRLRQIFTNLTANGLKFTEKGEVQISVQLVSKTYDRVILHCSVSDTGIGIPEDKQDKLFAKFSQVDNSTTRKFGGSGLGLAICKQLVEMMDGEIGVESIPDEGSVFWFTVTLQRSAQTLVPLKKEHRGREQENDMEVSSPRILLVEDNAINQMVAGGILEKLNPSIHITSSGEEAVQLVHDQQFDLILMDIELSEMNGYKASRQIRQAGYRMPIIGMSAHASKGYHEQCLTAGMQDSLSKPIDATELLETVQKWL